MQATKHDTFADRRGRRYLVSLSSTRPIGPLKKWEHRTSGVTY